MTVIGADEQAWVESARALAADSTDMERLLEHIEAGWRLRAAMDSRTLDSRGEKLRRSIVRELTALCRTVGDRLATTEDGSDVERLIAEKVGTWTARERAALKALMADPGRDPLGRALAVEAMRGDLEWLAHFLDRVEREPGAGRAAWLELELARVRHLLGESHNGNGNGNGNGDPSPADARREALRVRCDRMRGVLLERRVRKQLDDCRDDDAPERLASAGFKLSRLQTRVDVLEDRHDERDQEGEAPAGGDPKSWSRSLAERRAEVADRVERKLLELDPADAIAPADRIVQGARDELREIVAFLEDAPLRRAVRRLELVREDLTRLVGTFRRLAVKARRAARGSDDPGADEAKGRFSEYGAALRKLRLTARAEWRERLLALRLRNLLGRRGVAVLDNVVLVLVTVLAALILTETFLERTGRLNPADQVVLAWADLAICSGLLAEFGLRLILAPDRGMYFLRHFAIDLLASLPFGFLAYALDPRLSAGEEETLWLLRYLRFARLLEILIYLRVAMPVIRLTRVGLFALRVSDRLVRKNAGLLNRNIVLFEPHHAYRPESSDRHKLALFRRELQTAEDALTPRLGRDQQDILAARALSDLGVRLDSLSAQAIEPLEERWSGREIPVEALVEQLIHLTPEELLDRMGQAFVTSADSYLRVLDAPIVRRLPLLRNLVAHREKSPAEAVALAANYVGQAIQSGLDLIYFLADLQATLSPAIFLDRLGAALVNATRVPAKRLLWLGSAFLILFLVVNAVGVLSVFRPFVDFVQKRLGWPVIALGFVCLIFWMLGAWFRKIANQAADFRERIVEAQFAAQTKIYKARRSQQDARFLAERVIDPELRLRASDDRRPDLYADTPPGDVEDLFEGRRAKFPNRELAFLRTMRLLYQDYLDGPPFHRNDTKASVQLLGNLALTNLRRSDLRHFLRDGRTLGRLDLNRAGGLFGGPHLWFDYITRSLIQETALLLLDYNRHAVPLERLARATPRQRLAFQQWLAGRLRIQPEEVRLPESTNGEWAENQAEAETDRSAPRRREADEFLETVEFTAIDFLADDPERDAEIQARFGPQVVQLLAKDRRQNVRRAFRSFPLQELPLAQRTINPLAFYETHLSGGRIVFFPAVVGLALARSALSAIRAVYQGVHQLLNPRVARDRDIPADAYAAALRKVHRMRKPVFMGSLWLRARLDVEYLGLPLPTAPPETAIDPLMEADLDFIGASRRDRNLAETIRRDRQRRLEWVGRWLRRFGWTFDELPAHLAEHMPHLANRGGEALRALVAALVLDHDDAATLASSIEALTILMDHAADPKADSKALPPGLPDPVTDLKILWRPVGRWGAPCSALFDLPCFPNYDPPTRKRIRAYLRRHKATAGGWIRVVLGQGGGDPWGEVRARLRDVLLKTDLWSDQILVLRAVQTLTMLDVHHNGELVWRLGGYSRPGPTHGNDVWGGLEGLEDPSSTPLRQSPSNALADGRPSVAEYGGAVES